MAFKRYDGFYSKLLQEKFDNEMATCPFCGDNPHWLLDLKSGLIKSTVTCMCEKCGAKLYTEGSMSGWNDNLRVVDVGSRNINNLTVNGTYNIKTLGNIPTQLAVSGSDVFDASPNAPASTFSNCADTSATDVQNVPTPTTAVPQSDAAGKSSHKNIWKIIGGAAIVILVVVLAIFFSLQDGGMVEDNKMKKLAEDCAYTLIKDTLKSPSSARLKEVSYMENNDKGQYIVYVDVEAQNSFGTYIRGRYFVIVCNLDLEKKTCSYNPLFYRIECSGKNDTYNLNLIKSMNNYSGDTNENSYKPIMKKNKCIFLKYSF